MIIMNAHTNVPNQSPNNETAIINSLIKPMFRLIKRIVSAIAVINNTFKIILFIILVLFVC